MGTINNREVTDDDKEMCARLVMRRMIEKYSEKNDIPYDEAFFGFASSKTYKALFDFETGIWREGPDYLLSLYDEEHPIDFLMEVGRDDNDNDKE